MAFTKTAGVNYGTPALVLSTTAADGSNQVAIRNDSQIIAFGTADPEDISYGQTAAPGTVALAARLDHDHGMAASDAVAQSTIAQLEAETNNDTYCPPDLLRYARSTSSVWCRDSGGGADSGSMNISGVSHDSTGQDTYSFNTSLENADVNSYVLGQSGGADSTASVSGTSTSSVTVKKWTAGSLTNQAGFMACFGDLA